MKNEMLVVGLMLTIVSAVFACGCVEESEVRYVEEPELRHVEEPKGSISITSDPSGASVYLDGTHRGTTPISLDNVVSGSHTIELTKSGYESKTLAVSLSVGGAENIRESLEPLTGSISISSDPSGANIYLDEASNGFTPKTISDVQTGSHTIQLEKSGYESVMIATHVYTGETATVYETLTSKTGSISISSTPPGANIYLDGIYKGTTPTTISGVLPGSHAIRLEKNDYEDYLLESVSVTAGVTTPLTVNLILKPVLVPCEVTVPNIAELWYRLPEWFVDYGGLTYSETFDIYNPNQIPVDLYRIDYEIRMQDVLVSEGNYLETVSIPARGRKSIKIHDEIVIPLWGADIQIVVDAVARGKVDIRLKGRVYYKDTEYGPLPSKPFDRTLQDVPLR